MPNTCSACAHFDPVDGDTVRGICRRHAPHAQHEWTGLVNLANQIINVHATYWPLVSASDRCGEFTPAAA